MTCPICDQKPMNCDCTETDRRQFSEIEDLEAEIERLRLTDAEREAVEIAIGLDDSGPLAATLRGLLERTRVEPPDLTVSFRSSPHHRQHVAGSNTGQNSGV